MYEMAALVYVNVHKSVCLLWYVTLLAVNAAGVEVGGCEEADYTADSGGAWACDDLQESPAYTCVAALHARLVMCMIR